MRREFLGSHVDQAWSDDAQPAPKPQVQIDHHGNDDAWIFSNGKTNTLEWPLEDSAIGPGALQIESECTSMHFKHILLDLLQHVCNSP